jgi:hypothetical protein
MEKSSAGFLSCTREKDGLYMDWKLKRGAETIKIID